MTTFIKKDEFSSLVQANKNNRNSAVLSAAAELFALNESPSLDDLLHFEELCLRFLPKLDLQTKAEISERLSTCTSLPHDVAMTLAREDISVAAPILKFYYGFKEDDLLVILANGNQLHALAISSREFLSDKITIALSQFKLPNFEAQKSDNKSATDQQGDEDPVEFIPSYHAAAVKIQSTHIQQKDKDTFTIGLDAFLANEHAHILTLSLIHI